MKPRDNGTFSFSDVTLYLQSLGGKQHARVRDVAEVWTLEDAELLIPIDRSVADYGRRMGEVLADLSRLQDRSEASVLQEILNVAFDVVRFRLQSALSEDGTLPLSAGLNLVSEARELFTAAACAALQPRALFPNRKPREVNEVLDAARLGQTELGSYVVSVKNPVPPRITMDERRTDEKDEPLARRTTTTLLRSLRAANPLAHCLELGREVDHDDIVRQGGSANFFESLANLFPRQQPCLVTVEVSWAAHRPGPEPRPRPVLLESASGMIWREYGRQLRRSTPLPDYELAGPIVLLKRDSESPPQRQGCIEVRTMHEGKLTRVLVDLPEKQYSQALAAHDDGRWVFCVGELQRERRSSRLLNPRDIRFEPAGEN